MKRRRSIYHPDWSKHDPVLMVLLAAFFLLGQLTAAYLKLCGFTGCG